MDEALLIPPARELRARNRFRLKLNCVVFGGGAPLQGSRMQTLDIAKGGVSLVWESQDLPPALGEALLIEIDLPSHPDFGGRALVFETQVVRVDRASDGQVVVATRARKTGFRDSGPLSVAAYGLNDSIN